MRPLTATQRVDLVVGLIEEYGPTSGRDIAKTLRAWGWTRAQGVYALRKAVSVSALQTAPDPGSPAHRIYSLHAGPAPDDGSFEVVW